MKIGVLLNYRPDTDIDKEFEKIAGLGLTCCQLCGGVAVYSEENARRAREASQKHNIEITALWAGWTGPGEWNFYGGPQTLGIVPPAYRFTRLKELMAGADFAKQLGVTDVITHVGFLPENPNDPDFTGTCAALRYLANYLKANGQYFLFETGQETPVTMLRAIEEIGTDNLGINFDTANLILYGKSNSLDAIDIFGKYIRNTHMKDGEFPTCGKYLGVEKPLGQGRADISQVVRKLHSIGYPGPLIIEREISGDQQIKDIVMARDLLAGVLKELDA